MKKYFLSNELMQKGINIVNLYHVLAQSDSLEAYAFVTSKQNKSLFREGAYLRIPRIQIQLMEANLIQGHFYSEIEIPHYDIKFDGNYSA